MAFDHSLGNYLGIQSCREASTVDHKAERLDLMGLDLEDLEDPDKEDPGDPNTEDPVVWKSLEDLIPVGLVDQLTKV